MDCAYASELLSPYIDDLLDEEEARALRAHLDNCAACGAEYDGLVRMREALLRIPERPLPAEFDDRLRRALARPAEGAAREARASRSRRRLKLWSSAAAVFAIALLSLFAFGRFDLPRLGSDPENAPNDAALSAESNAEAEAAPDAGRADAGAPAGYDYVADANAAQDAAGGADGASPAEAEPDTALSPLRLPDDIAAFWPGPYARYEGPVYPGRGTTTGSHRLDEKTVCDELLREKLAGWTYEILHEEKRDGAFVYRVKMISNETGTEFNQEIEVVVMGKDVRIYYATEFMGL
jgi:hypothetical protein